MSSKQTWRLSDREVEILSAALQNLDAKVEFDNTQDQKMLQNLKQRFEYAVDSRKPK